MTRILIVEDEFNMVAGLRDNFELEGYDVIAAPDGVATRSQANDQTGRRWANYKHLFHARGLADAWQHSILPFERRHAHADPHGRS
jgi:CheY-like chemotaxis protein